MAHGPDLPSPLLERRRDRRHPAARVPAVRVSILAGPEVAVIDVSPHGLLIESEVRLTPGAAICLNIEVKNESYLVGGRVARVDAALSDKELKYRAGIALDSEFPPFDVNAIERALPRAETVLAKGFGKSAENPGRAIAPSPEGEDHERELTRLRSAFDQQKLHYEQTLAVVETLKAALRVNERSRTDAQEARKKERESWEHQRHALEEAVERSRRHEQESVDQAAAAADKHRALAEQLEQERTAWTAARAAFQEELVAAKTLPESEARELQALREGRATLERAVEEKRTTIAELVREKERLTAALEDLRTKLDDVSRLRVETEGRYERSDAEKRKLEHLLQTTENWCADQQELIYELAQQMLSSYARIQAWSSADRRRPRGGQKKAVDNANAAAEPTSAPAPEESVTEKSGA